MNHIRKGPYKIEEMANKQQKIKHIQSAHENIRPHECNQCEKRFNWKGDLKNHVKFVHQKIRQVQCSLCNKTFSENKKLTRHTKSIHDGLKPYKCDFCNLRSAEKYNLLKHVNALHRKLQGSVRTFLLCFEASVAVFSKCKQIF